MLGGGKEGRRKDGGEGRGATGMGKGGRGRGYGGGGKLAMRSDGPDGG